jgi:NAD(P)-dependent dehydrogenase (short-subunit alcohol dehydrogenase family)
MAQVIVTGANRGIGVELVHQYRERGDDVIAVCRSTSSALDALDVEVHSGIDVTDDHAVDTFANRMAGRRIDLLINNAGVLGIDTFGKLDWDALRRQYEVNTLGPLRVTQALKGTLMEGSKVAIITSRVGSMGDNSSGGLYGYRMSKAAVNMAGVNLAHDLKPQGVAVFLLHPGAVKTEMTHGSGTVEPQAAARHLIVRIDELDLSQTGAFFHAEGQALPW